MKKTNGSSSDIDETNNNTVDNSINQETSKVDDSKSDDNSIEEMSTLAIDPETAIPICETSDNVLEMDINQFSQLLNECIDNYRSKVSE